MQPIFIFIIALLLFNCSNHIFITATPLTPLVETSDKKVLLNLGDDFQKLKVKQRNAENTRTRRTFRIGKAQTLLFNNLIDAISASTADSKNSSTTTHSADISIRPILTTYQVVEPSASANNHYEVLLSYQLVITELATNQQDKWVIEGQGSFPKGTFTENRGFNQATKKALRHVGTQFLLGYSQRNFFK